MSWKCFTGLTRFLSSALLGFVAWAFMSGGAAAQVVPELRISTENSPSHVQTQVVRRFAERLQEKLSGRLKVTHFDSATLYRDRNVVQALTDGKVEMAVPGTWQLDRFEPNVGIFLLPMFYGRDAEINYRIRDEEIGQEINRRLGDAVGAVVIGRWIDLGCANLYSMNKPVESHQDLVGMRIRIPGGEANARRLKALELVPEVIAWPDLPQAMERGKVDGVLTTHATIVSAALWEKGIHYAFEDHQYFPQYIPILSVRFWNRLPADMQVIIRETWEEGVDEARAQAAAAQEDAARQIRAHGIAIATPAAAELARVRERMVGSQPDLITSLGIDPALVERVEQALVARP
ncbi:MAG: TRAP transporter substrate-binding protein DctP [Magnetospiraceae bacterium]